MDDPLADLLTPSPVLSLISTKKIPNVFPSSSPTDYRLAVVGEAPGTDEEAYGLPFIGASSKLLDSLLGSVGIVRSQCFVGNVCQYRPPDNKIENYGYDHPKVQEGLAQLLEDLRVFKPNCVLCLGNTPLWALTGHPFGVRGSTHSVSEYACFILPSKYDFIPKLVASYHPAFVLREYPNWVFLKLALARARQEACTPTLDLPKRDFELDLTCEQICHRLDTWPTNQPASIDIEGGLGGWICLSIIHTPFNGFIIAFGKHSDMEQARIYLAVSRFLYRIDVPKVLQNSLYEGFVLGYGFNMFIRNIVDDTMLKQWEIYPELPKGLDTVASIWTREPQWKFLIAYAKKEQLRRSKLPDYSPEKEIRNKHLACCIDSAVTLEASLAMDSALTPLAKKHYLLNVDLLEPMLYMELRGINYDKETARTEHVAVCTTMAETATRLELRVNPMQFTKTEYSNRIRGEKGSIGDQRLARVLYEQKGYPTQYKGRGVDKKVTCDVEALLNLSAKFPNDPFLSDVLLHRKLESIQETLEVSTDPDGRVRCGYNLVGTETGRLTCYTSPTGSGANLQTITKKLRKLYIADEGYHIFQCDLSGADGWTVAAHCLKHGDPTMWDDYLFGLKPAKILALMYHHGAWVNTLGRVALKELCDKESVSSGVCDQDSWLYFSCKKCQHGTNYDMKEKTLSVNIMKDSYKFTGQAIYVDPKICLNLQGLYLTRYRGIMSWHTWAKRCVKDAPGVPELVSAGGHKRQFFNRKSEYNQRKRIVEVCHDTFKEYLADEPQENTTYATNLAMHRLWYDVENRRDGVVLRDAGDTLRATLRRTTGGLYIPPAHQVHDALLGQIPKDRVEWAIPKIKTWFSNELTIANTKVTIPFEGSYGPSWGELGPKHGGGNI